MVVVYFYILELIQLYLITWGTFKRFFEFLFYHLFSIIKTYFFLFLVSSFWISSGFIFLTFTVPWWYQVLIKSIINNNN